MTDQNENNENFEELAQQKRSSFIGEFLEFLAHNKKWWLLPIILIMLLLGLLVILGGTPLAPFIYSMF